MAADLTDNLVGGERKPEPLHFIRTQFLLELETPSLDPKSNVHSCRIGHHVLFGIEFMKMAAELCVSNRRYTYIHDDHKGPLEAIDAHHVVVQKSSAKSLTVYLFVLLLTITVFSLYLLKDESIYFLLWSLLLSAFLVRLFLQKSVQKESVIIMPAFGVQLETQYRSGKTIHRFIPIDKILKPILNECVTPITCYWSLSLIVREEEELILVFKELSPPVKMLIPIWKALCVVTDIPGTLAK
ncbi:hypothetical protein U1Q18_010948 [Sarracenia purpurea var. burkii]